MSHLAMTLVCPAAGLRAMLLLWLASLRLRDTRIVDIWWGIFILCLEVPGALATSVSPIVMSVLLMRVSGVPLLERSLARRRPGRVAYQRRTGACFPRPPRP